MATGELASSTIHDLRVRLAAGDVSPEDILEDVLARIEERNGELHAFLKVDPAALRAQLREQSRRAPQGRLSGIPIAVKDNICLAGEETACASRVLRGFRPPYDATVVERLRAEGAILIPRANMDEFAFGSSTENSAFGPARNPRDPARVPGGSSGGSAAAVAGNLVLAALGSDTGGSIRQPASFCGIVGLKPTYGRVSRYGLIAFASSLDQIGPLAKDARDTALLLSVIAGHDPKDSTSQPVPVPDYPAALETPLGNLTVGLLEVREDEALDRDTRAAMDQAKGVFASLGLKTVPVELPSLRYAVATYYVVATAEASSNLARYDGVQYGLRVERPGKAQALRDMYLDTRTQGFGDEAKRRILLGTYVLSQGYYDAYYLKGMKVRTVIKRDFDGAFTRCQVLAMPTSPGPAFRLGEKIDDPLTMYLSDIYTISANLAGLPALSMPCGETPAGLPLGLQLVAPPFEEARILQLAHAFEQATGQASRRGASAGRG